MGYIETGSTVVATAYLTETGRRYLFNESNDRFDSSGNDLFQIVKFALSDSDTNYNATKLLDFGQVPGVTGDGGNANKCLKTTANYVQSNLVAYAFDNRPPSSGDIEYSTDLPDNKLVILESELKSTTEKP